MTCHTDSEISFKFYTNPFQAEVWLCILVSMLSFTVLTDVFVLKYLKLGVKTSLFFYIGAFLEETSSMSEKLLNHSAFRVGVGPWILLSSILSNVQVSLILRGLNAPQEPNRFSTFQDLVAWNSSKNITFLDVMDIVNYYEARDKGFNLLRISNILMDISAFYPLHARKIAPGSIIGGNIHGSKNCMS